MITRDNVFMPIELRCPGCSRSLRVPEKVQGKRIRCPKCGHVFIVETSASKETSPTPPPPARPAPKPAKEQDPLASGAVVPLGKTKAEDIPPGKTSPNKGTDGHDPHVTEEHSPDPEDMAITVAMEGARPADPDASTVLGESRAAFSNEATRAGGRERGSARDVPATFGGYQVLKELGRGGMGTVYLGRQIALDRLVALKVMNPERAQNPGFVARFTREAFAAAQLVHHNVVQVYDIGADHGTHFYSMEYVKGESLMSLLMREGKVDIELAVGYILQAARGLKFGHDLGMVHRDVKPDNLLLNEQGIVKVADLGLVKVALTEAKEPLPDEPDPGLPARPHHARPHHVTRVGVAVGTPTYMSPEQARDAANVDARADIYSLGCTLYVLLTGQPPFEGKTVIEVLTKHASAPIVPPDVIVKRVSKALSNILVKMMAKKPDDRYRDMGEVIAVLEKHLGIQQAGAFTPKEEHAQVLEQCVKKFNEAPRARLRSKIILGFAGGCLLALLAFLLFGWLRLAGGIFGLALLTPLCYFLVHGWMEKSHLFLKVREWALAAPLIELAYGSLAGFIFLLILYLFGLLLLWLGLAVVAIALAVALYVMVDRPLARERKDAVDKAFKLLRSMRLQGLEERALRQFICKYSGRDWEELYEALFGYEAKRKARDWLRGEATQKHKFAAWRDPIVAWIDAHQRARKEARERKLLQAVEAKALEAQGVDAALAQQKAAQVALVMVQQAAEVQKEADKAPSAEGRLAKAEPVAQAPMRQLLEAAQQPETVYDVAAPRRPAFLGARRFLAGVLGPNPRFLAGAILLVGCIFWMFQNHYLEGDRLVTELADAFAKGDGQKLDHPGQPLTLPFLPELLRELFHGLAPGLAGLILIISAMLGGWRASLLAWPAALVTFLGPTLGIPSLGPLSPGLASLSIGLALVALGLLVGLVGPRNKS